MQFLEKLWEMWENIEMLNLQQKKREELFGVRTKLSDYKIFDRTSISNRNQKM